MRAIRPECAAGIVTGRLSRFRDSGLATRGSQLNNSLFRKTLRARFLNPILCRHAKRHLDKKIANFHQQLLILQDFTCKPFRSNTLRDFGRTCVVQNTLNQYFTAIDIKFFSHIDSKPGSHPGRSRSSVGAKSLPRAGTRRDLPAYALCVRSRIQLRKSRPHFAKHATVYNPCSGIPPQFSL
jgi:hypothetical protein